MTKLQIQGSTDNSSFSDITAAVSSALADGDSGKALIVDVCRNATYRYIRPVVQRATANAVINNVVALQYRPRTVGTTQPASVSSLVKVAAAG